MGRAALNPSPGVGRLFRAKRKERRLTLREVSQKMQEMGDRIPVSTLVRIEQGQLDPGVRRLHLLLRFYEVPPHLLADLVELDNLAVEPPVEKDLEKIYHDGVEHWKQGNVALGLAHLFAIRQYVPSREEDRALRQKATLAFAVAARNLGKFQLARQIVDELLCEPPNPEFIVEALVLAASLWRGLGSLDVALALVNQAETHLKPGDHQHRAWVLHQQAKLLVEAGRHDQAEHAVNEALQLYRKLNDTYGEVRALVLRVRILDARGQLERAFTSAEKVLKLSRNYGHERIVISGHLEVGRLLLKKGSVDEALRALREGLGKAVLLEDRSAEFMAHYYMWKAHEIAGSRKAANFELGAARYLVQFIDDSSPESDEVRKLLKERMRFS